MFASKTPRDLNRDPAPWLEKDGRRWATWAETDVNGGARPVRRPEYDVEQHNTPNPILVRFRKWVEGETLADPCWAVEWVEAMDDTSVESDAALVLDELYETPYRRRDREAQERHARRVISRLASLAESAEV